MVFSTMPGYFLTGKDLQTLVNYLTIGKGDSSFNHLAQNLMSAASGSSQDLNLLPGHCDSLTATSPHSPPSHQELPGNVSRSTHHRNLYQGCDRLVELQRDIYVRCIDRVI